MIKFIILAVLIVFAISCTPVKGEAAGQLDKTLNFKGEKFGKELTLKKITKISDILKTPKSFVNKKVLVKGTVTSVCSKRGCWMDIVGSGVGERIRIKVTDGQIVFPVTVKGKDAVVEGVIYPINVKSRQGRSECGRVHNKNDAHTDCQQKTAPGVKTIYQLKGSSAVILD